MPSPPQRQTASPARMRRSPATVPLVSTATVRHGGVMSFLIRSFQEQYPQHRCLDELRDAVHVPYPSEPLQHRHQTGGRNVRDLAGKCAVVTGSASGMGYGLSVALAERGMNVVVAD